MSRTPFVGFGNDTLAACPTIAAGDVVECDRCGGTHSLAASSPPLLLTVRCGEVSLLVGIKGKDIRGRKADVSGKVEP